MTDPIPLISQRLRDAIAAAFGPDLADTDPLLRPAQNPRFGDYQANVAMPLAKALRLKPRDAAQRILDHFDAPDLCEVPRIAGPGFINLTLTPDALAAAAANLAADQRLALPPVPDPQTVVIDYSSPNVAKEMHVGHLRSTIIGDALARTLEFLGHNVIRQNHLGDWGTQFGMLIENLLDTFTDEQLMAEDFSIADLNDFYQQAKARFDADPGFADRARRRVVQLQSGDDESQRLWQALRIESLHHFDHAYHRLDITLADDDICPESFYNPMLADTVADLEAKGLTTVSDGATCLFLEGFTAPDNRPLPLIVRKADGGYLYATTDLAAVRHRVENLHADRIIYVTDARQKQHFAMVFAAARKAAYLPDRVAAEHVPFGSILGPDNRPFKTREGKTVRLADLLDEAEKRAADIVHQKSPDLPEDQKRDIAHDVGIGAVKYADLSTDRIRDYIFDFERMLAMDGNTAPYLQYAHARIRSIRRRAAEPVSAAAPRPDAPTAPDPSTHQPAFIIRHPAERALVLKLMQFAPTVRAVAQHLEPHRLCNFLYDLAVAYSAFYENCPVLRAESHALRQSRLALCDLTATALRRALSLLGIRAPQRM